VENDLFGNPVSTPRTKSEGRFFSDHAVAAPEPAGPLPGIDISDSAALQEMEDMEYVERMKHFE
jgi:hypothetical protein